MQYYTYYHSPLGKIILSADDIGLTGLWFDGQKYAPPLLGKEKELPIFELTKNWLNDYFSANMSEMKLPLHFTGTDFQYEVWQILCSIPYGKTMTYGAIAKMIADKKNIRRMAAQAIGGAVGHNKISIIVPCHRVVGRNGDLTGYAGGIDRKIFLLKLEKANMEKLFIK